MMPTSLRALRTLAPLPPAEDGADVVAQPIITAESFAAEHGANVLEALELGGLVQRDEAGVLSLTEAGAARLG